MSICAMIRRLSLMCSSGLMRKRMLAPAWVLLEQGVGCCGSGPQSVTWTGLLSAPLPWMAWKALSLGWGHRLVPQILAAEREVVEQLGADAVVAVDLEHGARGGPPVLGEDVAAARADLALGVDGGVLAALLRERDGVAIGVGGRGRGQRLGGGGSGTRRRRGSSGLSRRDQRLIGRGRRSGRGAAGRCGVGSCGVGSCGAGATGRWLGRDRLGRGRSGGEHHPERQGAAQNAGARLVRSS